MAHSTSSWTPFVAPAALFVVLVAGVAIAVWRLRSTTTVVAVLTRRALGAVRTKRGASKFLRDAATELLATTPYSLVLIPEEGPTLLPELSSALLSAPESLHTDIGADHMPAIVAGHREHGWQLAATFVGLMSVPGLAFCMEGWCRRSGW